MTRMAMRFGKGTGKAAAGVFVLALAGLAAAGRAETAAPVPPADLADILARERLLAQNQVQQPTATEEEEADEPVVIMPQKAAAAPAQTAPAEPPQAPVDPDDQLRLAPGVPPLPGPPNAQAQGAAPGAAAPAAPPPDPLANAKYPEAAKQAAEMKDIMDIHDVKTVPSEWAWLAWLALGLVAAGGLAYAIWWWWNLPKKPRKLPHELALEKLESMRALMTPEKVKPYSYGVSEVVRQYIEARFHARAAHRTTEEFLYDLVHQPNSSLAGYTEHLQGFLTSCDMVKFAEARLTQAEMEEMHASAVRFVTQTAPRPEENAAVPGASGAASPSKTK